MRKLLTLVLGVYLALTGLTPAHAQNSARLSLYALQTGSFPTLTVGLDVFDDSGNFATGLTPSVVTLREDSQSRPLTSFKELQPGVEFALALDPGAYFAYRDANAVTRFDKVVQALKDWAVSHPDALDDDLSLIPTGGTAAIHLATTAAFSQALAAYQPNLAAAVSSTATLSGALDTVLESSDQPERKPVVLYITSLPAPADIPVLQNLTQRATAGMVHINVWLVASQDYFSTAGATALKDLALQTGGQIFLFSGREQLPSPEQYLATLRHAYRLEYSSGILASGTHTLSVQVNLNGVALSSTELSFELDIQPPNPILVSPPGQIVRTAPDERTTEVSAFLPTRQEIDILVEFPDKRQRPLVRTVLYADGVQVAENTSAPFDKFSWDLSGYAASGEHILTVEALDTYGLSKVSLGVPVLVTVVRPPSGLLPWLSRNSLWVALGAILFAGGGLAAILSRGRVRKQETPAAGRKSRRDPLTQGVPPEGGKRNLRLPWNRPVRTSAATMVRLRDTGVAFTAPPIPIGPGEVIFGSDPLQATYILDDPSVSPLHARLKLERGEYILSDEKSVAGTWVNYEQVTTPRRLKHGDVLHFGRLSYRFMLRNAPELPRPRVTPTR